MTIDWPAPVAVPERKPGPGTQGRGCQDILREVAPGRNLRNWPLRNYIRPAAGSIRSNYTVSVMVVIMIVVAVPIVIIVVPPIPIALLIFL